MIDYVATVTEKLKTRDPVVKAAAETEDDLRAIARGLLAQANVSQRRLAEFMGVSQSSVSHMLTDRSYGLTTTEVYFIELLAQVAAGTIYRQLGFVQVATLEQQIYEIPGINEQAAEAIVAAIQAVKANALRQERQP